MVVLKTYYEIVDRPSIEVNKCWKVCHIILYIAAAMSGLFSYIIFNDLEYLFGENCILFPTIIFTTVVVNLDTGEPLNGKKTDELIDFIGNVTNTTTKVVIDESKTIWGNEESCDYYEYLPIVSFLVGIIFVTFYCMCPRGGSRLTQAGIRAPWNIVPVTLLLTGIFTIIILHGYVGILNGIEAFCAEFKEQLNKTECSYGIGNFSLKEEKYYHAYTNINLLRSVYFVCVMSWFLAFLLLIARSCCCVIDFKLMKLTISTLKDYDHEDESSDEEEDILSTHIKTGSLNEIKAVVSVKETQELLTKPIVNRRKSLPYVYF